MNKQLFIEKMNENSKYMVNLKYIEELIETAEMEKEELKQEIIKKTSIDPADKKAMLSFLNENGCKMEKYTNIALQELYDITGNKIFELLLKYNRKVDKHIKLNSFYSNIETVEKEIKLDTVENVIKTAYISPIFALNTKGAVSISKPALPFNIDEIKSILGYNYAIQLDSLEDIAKLLQKFSILINREDKVANFLIINTTIYLNLDYFMDVDIEMDAVFKKTKKYELLKEFIEKYGNPQDFPVEIEKTVDVKTEEIEADSLEELFSKMEVLEQKAIELKEEVIETEEEIKTEPVIKSSIIRMMTIINSKRKVLDRVLEEGRKERAIERQSLTQAQHVVNVLMGWNYVLDHLETQN